MKLWLVQRKEGFEASYDEYRGFVVSAESEERVKELIIEFFDSNFYKDDASFWKYHLTIDKSENIEIKQIGISIVPEGIILVDFYEG